MSTERPEIKPLIVEGAVDVSRALKFWEIREGILACLQTFQTTLESMGAIKVVPSLPAFIKEIESI